MSSYSRVRLSHNCNQQVQCSYSHEHLKHEEGDAFEPRVISFEHIVCFELSKHDGERGNHRMRHRRELEMCFLKCLSAKHIYA